MVHLHVPLHETFFTVSGEDISLSLETGDDTAVPAATSFLEISDSDVDESLNHSSLSVTNSVLPPPLQANTTYVVHSNTHSPPPVLHREVPTIPLPSSNQVPVLPRPEWIEWRALKVHLPTKEELHKFVSQEVGLPTEVFHNDRPFYVIRHSGEQKCYSK